MIMAYHGIGLIRPRHAIRPVVLHVLPPAAQAVQADDQGGHGRHARHQVHRPVLPASPGSMRLWTGSLPGKALALWGSREHGLPPVLVWQRILVAHSAAWGAGIWLVSIVVVMRVRLGHP